MELALLDNGSLLIGQHRALRKLSSDGRTLTTVQTLNDGFVSAVCVAPKSNTVYFTTRNAVRHLLADSSTSTLLAGSEDGQKGCLDATGASARFATPRGLVFGANRRSLLLSDRMNHCIRSVSLDGTATVTTVAGYAKKEGFSDIGGIATDWKFNYPHGLVCDDLGNIIFVDSGNHCVRGISCDASEAIYAVLCPILPKEVCDLCVAYMPRSVKTLVGTPSQSGFDNGKATEGKLNNPTHIAFDELTGDVYISERHAIRRWSNGELSLYAGTNNGDRGCVDGLLLNARFFLPYGLAIDSRRRILYVADCQNHVIRTIDLPVVPPWHQPVTIATLIRSRQH